MIKILLIIIHIKKNNIKRNRAASSSNVIIDKYNLKKMKKKSRIKNYFYQKSLRNNKNKNNDYYQNDKYDNYKKKYSYSSNSNMNLLTTNKKNIKIKNFFNERNNRNNRNIINNNNYNQINKKDNEYKIFTGKNFIDSNDNIIDAYDNKTFNDNTLFYTKNILYEDNNNNYCKENKINNANNSTNMYEKINIRNNSFRSPNNAYSNNKNEINNFQKNKSYNLFEKSNIRTQRNMSFNKSIKNNFHLKNYYENEYDQYMQSPINDIKKNIIKNNNKKIFEKIVFDIIDITNEFNKKENKANINNIIDEYKILLKNIKTKDKFIFKLINKYNNINNCDLNYNDPKSLLSIWNWINQNNINASNNNYVNNEEREYIQLCRELMGKYKLNNIEQLINFINKSLKKNDNNDNFLEGIKRILSA